MTDEVFSGPSKVKIKHLPMNMIMLKIAYLKVMVNMTLADDGIVDEDELAEILQLMTRLDLTIESRYQVREYITNSVEGITLSELMTIINSECPNSQLKATHISLVKDLISIYKSVKDGPLSDFSFFLLK